MCQVGGRAGAQEDGESVQGGARTPPRSGSIAEHSDHRGGGNSDPGDKDVAAGDDDRHRAGTQGLNGKPGRGQQVADQCPGFGTDPAHP